nr:hypothetical protein [Tanacetum cinerariifolium]GEZ38188.1 hypothetical protein [Tanacetum cinerariifolium]
TGKGMSVLEGQAHWQQASLGYVFDPTHSTEVSSEAVSSSQGIVEPYGSIGALAGGRAIAHIISGSPVLETLVLGSCYGFEVLDISNDSVKNFVICGYSSEMDTLRINAPHIESLTIKDDFDLKAILLLNMSSVIQA